MVAGETPTERVSSAISAEPLEQLANWSPDQRSVNGRPLTVIPAPSAPRTRRLGRTDTSTQCSVFRSETLVEGLIVKQPSLADRRRGGENVTVILYRRGLSARSRSCTSVSTLTHDSFRA